MGCSGLSENHGVSGLAGMCTVCMHAVCMVSLLHQRFKKADQA